MQSPLLLGLSAINKLGDISIEGNDLVILNAKQYTYEEIESIRNEAYQLYESGFDAAAAEKFEILYKAGQADAYDLMCLGISRKLADDTADEALKYLLMTEVSKNEIEDKLLSFLYNTISDCYSELAGDLTGDAYRTKADKENLAKKSLVYAQKALACAKNDLDKSSALCSIALYYSNQYFNKDENRFTLLDAKKYFKMALDTYCKAKKIATLKIENYNGKDESISYISVKLLECRYFLDEITRTNYISTLNRYAAKGNKYASSHIPNLSD